jgi:hypothetical protein
MKPLANNRVRWKSFVMTYVPNVEFGYCYYCYYYYYYYYYYYV